MMRFRIGRLLERVRSLSKGWLVTGASVLVVIAIVGSVFMYRAYDYVQHDNDFCTSCHLMVEPFERFDQSAHRGLGCKACHRPSMIQRTKMALTQILEMPDSISQHADVPRAICSECHVQGNPDAWKQIANTVGHRLHLESSNPSLKGIECLDCHGAGIHEFAATDKTCGQGGCHEGVAVRLGAMSNLTIHCVACHDFTRPISQDVQGSDVNREITPRRGDCLSCHAMRDKVSASIPADEPHQATCGLCHNPHKQKMPAEAVKSCASGGCHERVDTISPMHRSLGAGVMHNCTSCHRAHDWKANGDNCTSCHSLEALDRGEPVRIKAIKAPAARMSAFDVALMPLRLSITVLAQLAPAGRFKHSVHKAVACKACHDSEAGHGVLKIRTITDCNGCHHSPANAKTCKSCHASAQLSAGFAREVAWQPSVKSATTTKTLTFKHVTHAGLGCKSCHQKTLAMRSVPSCTSCHENHHTEARNCSACHTNVKSIKQHNRDVHLSCSGSGCHSKTVNTGLSTQRAVCLTCHTERAKHEPDGDCASCHMIPSRRDAKAQR